MAEPAAAQATSQTVQPAAAAPISGTPTQLLATLPVTEPLTVGYTGGLFNSPADLKKKDKRGCSYRNQVLLKLATKKPKIGKNCSLSGGEWRADFGRTVIKKAGQVKLGKLLPDKFVYAQGAYGWTPAQRKAYANSTTTVAKATRMSIRGLIDENNLQLFSIAGFRFIAAMNYSLSESRDSSVLEGELAALKKTSPEFFESWTVASLLNAKSWGLSFALGVYTSTSKTLSECSTDSSSRVSYTGRSLKNADPCNNMYSIINQAARYEIKPIPLASSQTPPVSSTVLSGYGTPQGAPIDRHLFGIHAPADWVSDEASGFDGDINPATIPNVPVGYLRLWDTETTWRDIEPTNGQYVWRKLNKQIEMAQILDARVMLVLGSTPAWAGDGSVQSNPRNIADWRDYVGTVACKYGASISAYEVWNEANLQTFWKGTPAEMAELTKVAFEEIRRCNPSALVVAANTTSRATGSFGTFFPEYLEEMKKRGWPADAYSVHSYPTASGGADDRIKGISQFRSMLALAGAPFTTTFDTEINYGLAGLGEGKVDLSGANAMTLLSRTYIDSARYGFGSTFWFVWTANPDSKFGIQFTGASTNEQRAWRTTYDWLVGAQYQRCFETPEKVVVCQFNKGADNFSLVWRGDVGSATTPTSAGYFVGLGSQVCDLYGSCNVMTKDTALAVGPMPQRISGTPLGAVVTIPNSPPAPDQVTSAQIGAVEVVDVTLDYGVANKADALVTWIPPKSEYASKISKYTYSWRYCDKKNRCSTFGRGSTAGNITQVTTDLADGPGTYTITVTPVVTTAGGDVSGGAGSRNVELLSTRAVPPSGLTYTQKDQTIVISWEPPPVRSGLIKDYDVQTSLNGGPWKQTKATVGPTAKQVVVPWSEIGAKLGDTIQVRARTAMKSGLASIFVATPNWPLVRILPEPMVLYAYCLLSQGAQLAVFRDDVGGVAEGYLLRESVDGGSTWRALSPPDAKPGTPWNFGFARLILLDGTCGESKIEIRSVAGSADVFPSEWVPVTFR
jgi:cytochrome c2